MDQAVLYAFQDDPEVEGANFRMRGLDRAAEYVVTSDREGELGVWTGANLMDVGVDLYAAESTRAHLLTFVKVTPEEAREIRRKRLVPSTQ
jgi:hypothetical protein